MANQYKDSLNLPHTLFPMKANLAQREPEILARWQAMDLYQQMQAVRVGAPVFCLHDGPPYANGDIHLGHALNKILKDTIAKSRHLSGMQAPWTPGWDCHGLPIELNVEKKVGKPGVTLTAKAFRQACREYAQTQVDGQRQAFKRLGVQADWDKPYLTMSYAYEANIIRALAKMIAGGHLQQGRKPVHWCVSCASALAEAEVEYKDKTSPSIEVAFQAVNPAAFLAVFGLTQKAQTLAVAIWTTTPWTLPANQAVALHPELSYALVQCELSAKRQHLVVAESLVESIMQRYGCDSYQVLASCQGKELAQLQLHHPFYPRQVPIVLGQHVTVDEGTGAVHTAPAHGREDYEMALQHGLAVDNPVDANGCYVADTPLFAGEFVFKANAHVIEVLKAQAALLAEKMITHSYPHCWRHKTPVIFRATPQWFISMDNNGLRTQALQAITQVTWVPQWGQARIERMVSDRPDWCISRQRTWGVPMALFIDKKTAQLHPNTVALMEQVAVRVERDGIDAWFDLTANELLGDAAADYEKLNDIVDVWLESGVSHACVVNAERAQPLPADLYLEGSDQHRGWFQSSLLTAVAMHGQAPYKTVLTHGYTVDGQGRKMSKSLGNVVAPEKLIKTLGADIVRLWAASADYRAELNVADEVFNRTADAYRRLRNTARFLLANLHDFDPASDLVANEGMLALDRWIVARAQALQQEICAAYDEYQLHVVSQKLHHFCSIDLGSFYLDVIKDRQYTMQKASLGRRSTQTAMYHILQAFVRWLAPILSFTAEEIWHYMPGDKVASVFLTSWYTQLNALDDNAALSMTQWLKILSVRDVVNRELEKQRDMGHIGSALDASLTLYVDEAWQQTLLLLGEELHFVFITSGAEVLPLSQASTDAASTELAGVLVRVSKAEGGKCERCWHHDQTVGHLTKHPTLCKRCESNVVGSGENRRFV